MITESVSLDGVAEGDFFVRAGESDDAKDVDDALREQRERADALLLGRTTFEEFRGFWPQQTENPSGTAQYLNNVAKYVVSTTMAATDLGWENSSVLHTLGDVRALKEMPGADIVVTGSIKLAHSLIAAGLVDEYRLFTYPVVVGAGRHLFDGATAELRLVDSESFASGVTLTRYQPA